MRQYEWILSATVSVKLKLKAKRSKQTKLTSKRKNDTVNPTTCDTESRMEKTTQPTNKHSRERVTMHVE